MIMRTLKRSYAVIALFALIHLGTLVGLGAYAWQSGKLDRSKIEQIAALIRGEGESQLQVKEGETVSLESQDSAETSVKKIKQAIEAEDILRLKQERAKVELQREQQLLDRRVIALQRDREEFERIKKLEHEQRRKRDEQEQRSSYVMAWKAVAGMKPKNALDHLMQASENDVIKMLLAMDQRQSQRILDSCKTAEQRAWRDRILNKMLRQPMESAVSSNAKE